MVNTITDEKGITIKYSNEVPPCRLSGDEVLRVNKSLAFDCRTDSTVYIEVEMARHTGPRILYGRLGFLFEGIHDAEIQLEIPYSKSNSMRYQDSILLDSDTCYVGITEEYLNGIVQDICNFIVNERDFPCCKITLCNASNCEMGSCQAFYSIIIDTIMSIYMKHIDLFGSEQGEKVLLEYVKTKNSMAHNVNSNFLLKGVK